MRKPLLLLSVAVLPLLASADYDEAFTTLTPTNTVAKDNNGQWHAANIALVDAVQWYNPLDFETDKLTYTRHFGHTGWSALYVPILPNSWTKTQIIMTDFITTDIST